MAALKLAAGYRSYDSPYLMTDRSYEDKWLLSSKAKIMTRLMLVYSEGKENISKNGASKIV